MCSSTNFLMCLIPLAAILGFAYRRGLRLLRFFQQEEYKPSRFWSWYCAKRAFDTRASLPVLVCALLAFIGRVPVTTSHLLDLLASLWIIIAALHEEDPRLVGKIKLVMTERATRIFRLACIIGAATFIGTTLASCSMTGPLPPLFWVCCLVFLQLIPLWLVVAVAILQPGEDKIQATFKLEAEEALARVPPLVIGITGSYGKTSVKNMLGELLSVTLAPTFWTTRSVNTVMGITRELRTRLRPGTRFAIIEMGAYNIGSIKRLCDFTPPRAAIVTAVGTMHLERFGSVENIYTAKSELAEALPADGILVCNGDNPGARRMAAEHRRKTTVLYGLEPEKGELNVWASDITISENGTHFTLHCNGRAFKGFTKLLGLPALSNLVGAAALAVALGANPEFVVGAARNIQPTENRLSLKREGGITYLQDAFNSNPAGFAAALDVLAKLPAKRRILMTPGMIELGEMQEEENCKAGSRAAAVCEVAIIVGTLNRDDLISGLREGGFNLQNLYVVNDRESAFKKLAEIRQIGDAILIENDLPDLYEGDVRF